MKLQTSLSFLSLLLLTSCVNQVKNEFFYAWAESRVLLTQQQDWTVKTIEKQWQTGNCETESEPCFEIIIHYPQFQEGNGRKLKTMNQTIQEQVLASVSNYNYSENNKNDPTDLDQIVAEIFFEFNQLRQESTFWGANYWTIELNGEQTSETEHTITVLLSVYSYTGGAHPNSYQTYLNFDKVTGDIIELADLTTDPAAVLKVAEQKFRAAYNLTPNQPLTAAGLFENQLTLPENFAITQNGLLFFYNTYEIAPYAAGTYQFLLPWEALSGIHLKRKKG